ncbi:DivIVA domain-containing protein [Planomonospora sp. ID67723]|uniref:DivIVA domain-containing protein n=1 Tax=Planomonospora sp. ID67723 TaxID=2738134 RepID=UPI0018C3BC62|nr:DivIVA domain-containing protein [Planomonospora sp. ID67723]MBG0826726.1 DivIVA domain-containing protein [Planomonospora sp. ID67723]
MTNQHESFPDLMHEDSFEVVMRGYSRRQVHDYMIRTRNQIRELEERVARSIDQAEQGRLELAEARRRLSEAPQDYDELGQRLSQILKLGEEEASAKREVAEAEAHRLRDEAAAEAERLVTSARERAEGILTAAQQEAERRVGEATATAEHMLAQAGNDAEEKLNAARAEAEETLRSARTEAEQTLASARHQAEQTIEGARAEAESTLTSARAEAESTLSSANTEAHTTLTSAQQRAAVLDESTGRRVAYLTETHREVMRRLNEMGAVLGDLIHRENAAGALIDENAVLPPASPAQVPAASPVQAAIEPVPQNGPDVESVRVIVEEDEDEEPSPAAENRVVVSDGAEANLKRVREDEEELAARK